MSKNALDFRLLHKSSLFNLYQKTYNFSKNLFHLSNSLIRNEIKDKCSFQFPQKKDKISNYDTPNKRSLHRKSKTILFPNDLLSSSLISNEIKNKFSLLIDEMSISNSIYFQYNQVHK